MADEEISVGIASETQGRIFKKISRKNENVILVTVLILIGVGGFVFYQKFLLRPNTETVQTPAPATTEKASTIASGSDITSPVLTPLFGEANYRSENFRVGDVSIGGEAEFLLSEDSPEPLEISSIRGEAFTEKNKAEVKLVISWHTNKLAKSTISYSKGVGQIKKAIEEDDYSLNHSMIIPGLEQASTYVYVIDGRDRFGNQITSESHAVYTGSRTISLFDLIAGAVGDVFGWAIKKN